LQEELCFGVNTSCAAVLSADTAEKMNRITRHLFAASIDVGEEENMERKSAWDDGGVKGVTMISDDVEEICLEGRD
jgi:hypothetical protein